MATTGWTWRAQEIHWSLSVIWADKEVRCYIGDFTACLRLCYLHRGINGQSWLCKSSPNFRIFSIRKTVDPFWSLNDLTESLYSVAFEPTDSMWSQNNQTHSGNSLEFECHMSEQGGKVVYIGGFTGCWRLCDLHRGRNGQKSAVQTFTFWRETWRRVKRTMD